MAEVFGIVTGVLGLLPLCRGKHLYLKLGKGSPTNHLQDGFGLIREVLDANNTAELAVGRIEAQRDVSSHAVPSLWPWVRIG